MLSKPDKCVREQELRRLALGIVVQLPENLDEARRVLELSLDLISGYMSAGESAQPSPQATVLKLVT